MNLRILSLSYSYPYGGLKFSQSMDSRMYNRHCALPFG
jgi:hypothetical protein